MNIDQLSTIFWWAFRNNIEPVLESILENHDGKDNFKRIENKLWWGYHTFELVPKTYKIDNTETVIENKIISQYGYKVIKWG